MQGLKCTQRKTWTKRAFALALWGYTLVACAPPNTTIPPETPSVSNRQIPLDSLSLPQRNPSGSASADYGLKNILYWRVKAPDTTTTQGPTSYVVGTVHVNFAKDYPWPVTFENAFKTVKTLYLEADVSEIEKNPQAVLEKTLDPQQIVMQTLSEAEFQQLSERLIPLGVPQSILPLLKPWYVNLLLSAPPEEAVTRPTQVMDQLLQDKAQENQVRIEYLETALAQFEMMESIPTGEHIRLIRDALTEPLNRNGEHTLKTIAAYNQGDLSVLETAEAELKKESPPFYERSLLLRNQAWLKTLIPVMQTQPVMVGVGVLHMVGENGLIAQLRSAGFAVERVSTGNTGDDPR